MADTAGGYPITEADRCVHCADHHTCLGPGLIGPLCGFVAGLAAALVSVLMITTIDPPGSELRVAPPADAQYCGAAEGRADNSPQTVGTSAQGVPVASVVQRRP